MINTSEFRAKNILMSALTDFNIKELVLDCSDPELKNVYKWLAEKLITSTVYSSTNVLILSGAKGLSGKVIYEMRDIFKEDFSFSIEKVTGKKQYLLTYNNEYQKNTLTVNGAYYDSSISILHQPDIVITTYTQIMNKDKLEEVLKLFNNRKKLIKIYT